jgi:hypothetical protein
MAKARHWRAFVRVSGIVLSDRRTAWLGHIEGKYASFFQMETFR